MGKSFMLPTLLRLGIVVALTLFLAGLQSKLVNAATESGSVGLQGKISSPPPSQGATISFPTNGQSFTNLPITVTGICPDGLLVKLYKNNVFTGSAQCSGGNFSIQTDLFSGTNDLVARVYDDLDQAGPDSNRVSVSFNDPADFGTVRVSITSSYAKRGATPGNELTWPLTISGGTGPYAVSIDWGDKSNTDLISREFPGDFNISHIYKEAGVYNITVKVTDKNGVAAFLQLVGIGTGAVQDIKSDTKTDGDTVVTRVIVFWWPALLLIPLTILAFWLGHRNQMKVIRKKILQGQRPF